MKKLLLATSALVVSAGLASAQGIEFSGSAEMGVGVSHSTKSVTPSDNDGKVHVFSGANFEVSMSGMADNGMEFGTSIDVSAGGQDYDPGDFEFDGAESGMMGLNGVWVSYGGFKLTANDSDIDDLYDDDNSHDIQISYSGGGLSLDLTHDVDGDNSGPSGSASSYMVGYDANGISASLTGTDVDQMVLELGYETGPFSVGIELDDDMGVNTNTLSVGYDGGNFSVDASIADDDTWDLEVGFSQDAFSVTASTDENSEWELAGVYNAGGGLSFKAGVNFDSDYYLLAAMSF